MAWKTLIAFIFFAIVNNITFGQKIGDKEIESIEIRKISGYVHIIAGYNCDEYDYIFQLMRVSDQSTVDTIINDKFFIDRFVNILEGYDEERESQECEMPQIEVAFINSNGEKTCYYIGGGITYNVLNKEGSPILKDEWMINYLKSLGGFE